MTRIEPEEESFDPAQWSEEDAERHLREGVRLFNAGEYRAAHEEFERIWLSGAGDADFFKGLIQAAIAMHHFEQGNFAGAAKLYGGHRRYLAGFLPRHRGIDVAAFMESVRRTLEPVVRRSADRQPALEPNARPRIVLDP